MTKDFKGIIKSYQDRFGVVDVDGAEGMANAICDLCKNGFPYTDTSGLLSYVDISVRRSAALILRHCRDSLGIEDSENMRLALILRILELRQKISLGYQYTVSTGGYSDLLLEMLMPTEHLKVSYERMPPAVLLEQKVSPVSYYLILALCELVEFIEPYRGSFCLSPISETAPQIKESAKLSNMAAAAMLRANAAFVFGLLDAPMDVVGKNYSQGVIDIADYAQKGADTNKQKALENNRQIMMDVMSKATSLRIDKAHLSEKEILARAIECVAIDRDRKEDTIRKAFNKAKAVK